MFTNIQAFNRTFGFIILIIILFNLNFFTLISLSFFYCTFILYFIYYIYNNQFRKFKINPEYKSIFKDKEFILFKTNLFNFYYSTIIILLFFIFKNNGLSYLLDLNLNFILFLFSILIIYLFLLSNLFCLKLFKLYLNIKINLKLFNSINFFEPLSFVSQNKFKPNGLSQLRNYSTSIKDTINENDDLNSDTDSDNNDSTLTKTLAIKEFKKDYKGGYLGYNVVRNFGDIVPIIHQEKSLHLTQLVYNLLDNIKFYLNDIPENVLFSILPILKWKLTDGDYKTITISKSIKITRFSSPDVLLQRLILSIRTAVSIYILNVSNIDLLLIGRPWLSADDFNLPLNKVSDILDNNNLEQEINLMYIKNNYSNKLKNLLNYEYQNVIMDNYGEPQYDFNRNLIGYLIYDTLEYCTVETFYNDSNLLSNKVSIKEFDFVKYKFKGDVLVSWVDIKIESGFIR